MRPIIGETKLGVPFVALEDDGRQLLKAYASIDGQVFRIVLPELRSFAQPLINIDQHFIDFERDAKQAAEKLRRSGR